MKVCQHCSNPTANCQCRKRYNELAASALRRVRLAIKDATVSDRIKGEELKVIQKELDKAIQNMDGK